MAHKFYFTNNIGGGGTNVSRVVDYKSLFDLPNIGLLLNYYYLSGQANPAFDTKLLSNIGNFSSIGDFFDFAKEEFAKKRRVSTSFKTDVNPSIISGYMLDNGCGNILRDFLTKGTLDENSIKNIVKPFMEFSENLKFDFCIALDNAMKYTYKRKETIDKQLTELWSMLAEDTSANLDLIKVTLEYMKVNEMETGVYAPLHGFNYDSFVNYLKSITELENKLETCFTGFALGGIADARKLNNEIWQVPKNIKGYLKTGYIVSNLCKRVKEVDSRPLHVLGAGNIYALPFIIEAGASSSDCHSAWRRASDGGYEKGQILIPLLNDNLEFINEKNCLEYVKIKDLDNGYCLNSEISAEELKSLYLSENKEDYYFAEIFTFALAIRQYNLLINYIEKNKEDYLVKLCRTNDAKLNANYEMLISALNL